MKDIKKIAALFLIAIIFIFFLFAFGGWEINPGKWVTDARVMFSFILVILLAIIIMAVKFPS